jgi:hypothetical protein
MGYLLAGLWRCPIFRCRQPRRRQLHDWPDHETWRQVARCALEVDRAAGELRVSEVDRAAGELRTTEGGSAV